MTIKTKSEKCDLRNTSLALKCRFNSLIMLRNMHLPYTVLYKIIEQTYIKSSQQYNHEIKCHNHQIPNVEMTDRDGRVFNARIERIIWNKWRHSHDSKLFTLKYKLNTICQQCVTLSTSIKNTLTFAECIKQYRQNVQ